MGVDLIKVRFASKWPSGWSTCKANRRAACVRFESMFFSMCALEGLHVTGKYTIGGHWSHSVVEVRLETLCRPTRRTCKANRLGVVFKARRLLYHSTLRRG